MDVTVRRRPLFVCLYFAIALVAYRFAISDAKDVPKQNETSADQYPGDSDHPVMWRHDLSGNIAADRPLSLEELDLLLKLSDYLIDKTGRSFRVRAARDLGQLGHKYGIPALLAVARDESEPDSLRTECITALSMIRDKRVPGYLIDEWLGCGRTYNFPAFEGLVGLVPGHPPQLHDEKSGPAAVKWPPDDPQKRKHYVDIWRQWWAKHRDEIELGRGPGTVTF